MDETAYRLQDVLERKQIYKQVNILTVLFSAREESLALLYTLVQLLTVHNGRLLLIYELVRQVPDYMRRLEIVRKRQKSLSAQAQH